jgi:3-dehydroquinate synthetase
VLEKADLPTNITIDKEACLSAIKHDKKFDKDKITVIYVNSPGEFEMKKLSVEELSEITKDVI